MTRSLVRGRAPEAAKRLGSLLRTLVAVGSATLTALAHAQAPFDPPTAEVLTEARALVQDMVGGSRGPYSRVLWFCNDGTTQPPTAFACAERGGGRQHAEYSTQRNRLVALGWSVGTIFAALSFDELWDGEHRQQRLRELALERYMIDIDDGWVLRRARNYRGALQVEAEEAAGRRLLLELLGNRSWVADNYLLARESARVIPHDAGSDDRTRTIRRGATELADLDSTFGSLRVEIHGNPTAATAARVRGWAEGRDGEPRERASALAGELDALYGPEGRRARLAAWREALARRTYTREIAAQLPVDTASGARERVAALAATLRRARDMLVGEDRISATTRLLLLDTMSDLESELGVSSAEVLADTTLSRFELSSLARDLLDGAYGTGLLTVGEHRALAAAWPGSSDGLVALADYTRWADYLRRVPQWAVGSARYTFAEPLTRYTALDRRAGAFVDDLLRGSPLVGVATVASRLAIDVAALTGVSQNFNGEAGVAAFGLNPGIATGRLRVFATAEDLERGEYGRGDIVVLPETVADLRPVAGIVTLGEGSPLSHVQLLARNFGIANISIVPALLPALERLDGSEVLAAVASDGSLALLPLAAVPAELRELAVPSNRTPDRLTVPPPNLDVLRPIPLAELHAGLSGHVVGPKAANLGQLARLFPGRVAPALAVPFGIFAEHLDRAGPDDLRAQLAAAYAARREGAIDDRELDARLAAVRAGIGALRLTPARGAELRAAMAAEFGTDEGLGLFVRSDTNVEDLPQFTGAGLSETLANIVGQDNQLTAIPSVWASVLSPRAIAWRSSLLTNPDQVYASVLLMKSVPSDKSGVMVTTDVTTRGAGLTVSTAWGVGGAVGGEPTETLVLRADRVDLLSEAKSAYRRELDPRGGVRWRPAADGPVLTESDIAALRELAVEVQDKYPPALDERGRARPWDIEFGFVAGELTLFQIRPLVERGPQLADRVVRALVPAQARVTATVSLSDAPRTGVSP